MEKSELIEEDFSGKDFSRGITEMMIGNKLADTRNVYEDFDDE